SGYRRSLVRRNREIRRGLYLDLRKRDRWFQPYDLDSPYVSRRPLWEKRGIQGMKLASKALGFIALPALLLLYPLSVSNEYELRLLMVFMVYAIIALGLNVLVGLAGLVSLGQAGLFALGAYTASILATKAGVGLIACCIGSAVLASAFGVLLAYSTLPVEGVFLSVITIAFRFIRENVSI